MWDRFVPRRWTAPSGTPAGPTSSPGRSTPWIFDRVAEAVDAVNSRCWQFRIALVEPLQLLAYPEGGHFHWHSDLGDRGLTALRKVSATILLSDPSAYEGGDLQILSGGEPIATGRSRGRGIFFPAFQNHRVTPVTRGTRHVLIVWTLGPKALR